MFSVFTVLRSLRSEKILQIRTNRTEKCKWHVIWPKNIESRKGYINFTSIFYLDFPFFVTKMIFRSCGRGSFMVPCIHMLFKSIFDVMSLIYSLIYKTLIYITLFCVNKVSLMSPCCKHSLGMLIFTNINTKNSNINRFYKFSIEVVT
jgi:hypothetical protein